MPWWEILVALRPPGTSKSSAEFLAGGEQTEAHSKWQIVQEILGARLKVGFVISAHVLLASTQFSLVAQSCPTFCSPMDYSMPGLPVHH